MKHQFAATLVLTLAVHAFAADAVPSPEELQQLSKDKNWTGLLQATTRVLTLRGPAAAAYNRVDVWLLKAEAQLQSNQFSPASESFTHASAEKGATPEQVDLALSMAAVVKKSDRKGYIPKPTRGVPHPTAYDIFDPTKRKEAVGALLNAEIDDLTRKITKLKTSLEERPLVDMMKVAHTLSPMDRVANGSSDKTDALQKSICDNFVAAVQTWSDLSLKQVEDLNDIAQKMIQQQYRDRLGNIQIRQQKTGLTSPQQKQIRQIEDQAKRLAGTLESIEAQAGETSKTTLDPAKPTIQKVFDRADAVLKDAIRPD